MAEVNQFSGSMNPEVLRAMQHNNAMADWRRLRAEALARGETPPPKPPAFTGGTTPGFSGGPANAFGAQNRFLGGVGDFFENVGSGIGDFLGGGLGLISQPVMGALQGLGLLPDQSILSGSAGQAANALASGAIGAGEAERQALLQAFNMMATGQMSAFPFQQRGLQEQLEALQGIRGDIGRTLTPMAQQGMRATSNLQALAGNPLGISRAGTFDPTDPALRFSGNPFSNMRFGADPFSQLQFTAPTESGLEFGGQAQSGISLDFTGEDLAEDPGFQFRMQQGQEALERAAAAGGGLVSGRQFEAAQEFGQGLASEEFDRAFQRERERAQFEAGEFQRGFGREATAFQLGEDAFQRQFGREAAAFGMTADEFQRDFARQAAVFDRNAAEFGADFARQLQSHDRNQFANEADFRRSFDAFRFGEQNNLARDQLRLQDLVRRQQGFSTIAGLGAQSRNLLASLDARMSGNISSAAAAPALNQAANILRLSDINAQRFLAMGGSQANQQRTIANALAQQHASQGLAEFIMAQQFSQQMGNILGITMGAMFGGGGGGLGAMFGGGGGGALGMPFSPAQLPLGFG